MCVCVCVCVFIWRSARTYLSSLLDQALVQSGSASWVTCGFWFCFSVTRGVALLAQKWRENIKYNFCLFLFNYEQVILMVYHFILSAAVMYYLIHCIVLLSTDSLLHVRAALLEVVRLYNRYHCCRSTLSFTKRGNLSSRSISPPRGCHTFLCSTSSSPCHSCPSWSTTDL